MAGFFIFDKPMNKLEYKVAQFHLKSTDDGRGEFTGCANFCGYLDDGGDIIPEGGFNGVLGSFLKGGFIAHSHEWNIKDGVIGYPLEAHEDEDGLFIRGKFHSTGDAQDVRTKMRERSEDGLDVGLSIGYRGGSPIFIYPKDYDKELPKYLKPQFAAEGIQKAKRFKNIRVLPKLSELKEVSVVTSPMNILSSIDGVKENRGNSDESREQEMIVVFAPLSTKWDAAAANKRVVEWSQQQQDQDAAYKQSFLLPDNNDGVHKFPFADIVDGKLLFVEDGLKAATDEVLKTSMPVRTRAKLRGKISAYYKALSAQFSDAKVNTDWEDTLDEVHTEIQDESYRQTCKELGIELEETKLGARNAVPDRKRIQSMHDLACELQPDVCPAYSKETKNKEAGEVEEGNIPFGTVEINGKTIPTGGYGCLTCPAQFKKIEEAAEHGKVCRKLNALLSEETDKETDKAQNEKESITDISDWKTQRFKTEKLKTAALRQRAGLASGLSGA